MNEAIPDTPLSVLQDRFAILDLSGEIRVVKRNQISELLKGKLRGEIGMYKKSDAELLMKRCLEAVPISSNAKKTIGDFWTSPATIEYKEIAFTPKETGPTTLNFWVGPVSGEQSGNWEALREYLHDIICAGAAQSFQYLMQYLAHMVQRPEEKPGVMIVLLGGQGTGKGVFFQLLRAIWPQTTLQLSDIDQVTGRFNSQLERHYVICMDEALFAGDKKSMDRLKSTITEVTIQIEQKYQPSRSIESVHRFFAASNHDHFAHIERDDRRFAFFRVSPARQQDTAYFSAIVDAISNPSVIGALVYELQNTDLSTFNVRAKPKSDEHVKQKLMSLQGFDRFWYEVLVTGSLSGLGETGGLADDEWDQAVFVSTGSLITRYTTFSKNAQRHQTVQSQQVTLALRRLCPSARSDRQVCKQIPLVGQTRVRGFQLPELVKAREEFASAMGAEIDWE